MVMKRLLVFLILIMLVLTACTSKEKTINDNEEGILVYTSFYPLYFLAEEIGGDLVEAKTIVPFGVDSHDYEPSMDQLKELTEADIFIYNGANFESWVDKIIDSIVEGNKAINASKYCDLIVEDGVVDPHLWLDLENMIEVGLVIRDRFIELDEKNRVYYEENYENLKERLVKLDNKYIEELKDKRNDSIIVSHKAFGYLARRYGFNQIPVAGISPDQEPSPKTIANIIELIDEKKHDYIFLETLASPKTVEVIVEETNLEVLVLNPIENLTEEEIESGQDYITIMEKNLENLKKALVK
ncbi:MAG: zinc ABC transporter solute-binding protein [Tissierellia bacterium]|nr:zinc ABC transporter solute-binding protein [Tissierellia bacterium]